jgi:hypothetical protein
VNRADFDLASAATGSFALAPHDGMVESLRTDYQAMAGMMFGAVPDFNAVLAAITTLEERVNAVTRGLRNPF